MARRFEILLVAVVMSGLNGCAAPKPTFAQLLPGHWVGAEPQYQVDLEIRRDGTYSLTSAPRATFAQFLGVKSQVNGRWELHGADLLMTVSDHKVMGFLPAATDSLLGKSGTCRISELTRTHLTLTSGQDALRLVRK